MTQSSQGDTTADALAAAVRQFRPLSPEALTALVTAARRDPAGGSADRLVEHHLGLALDAAIERAGPAATLEDLFQEGSLALVTAVAAFLGGVAAAEALPGHLEVAVRRRLDAALREIEAARRQDRALAHDAGLVERTILSLRGRLGRSPSDAEVAAALEWPAERLATVSELISAARARHDEEIALYLDDE